MKNRKNWGSREEMFIDRMMGNFEREYKPSVFAVQDIDTVLEDSPHYTDKRFDHDAQTIFGKEGKGLFYNYSDRLWQWDYNKSQKSFEIADATGAKPRTARHYQEYLRAYFDAPKLELKHILAGVNVSNGYPYLVFGYYENK